MTALFVGAAFLLALTFIGIMVISLAGVDAQDEDDGSL